MDKFIVIALYLQMFFCAIMIAVFQELIFIFFALQYAVVWGFWKYVASMMLHKEMKVDVGFKGKKTKSSLIKPRKIHTVQSPSLCSFCHGLSINAQLEVNLVANVKSPKLYFFCKQLGLKAKLPFPDMVGRKEDLPIVYSRDVYVLCEALGIKVKLQV